MNINKEIIPLADTANSFKINNATDLTKSAELLSRCNQYLDNLIVEREKITRPMNEALKEVRAKYKPVTDVLESAISSLRLSQSAYQTELVRIQRLEEQKIADKLSSGKIKKVETALKQMSKVEQVVSKVETESGSLKFREVMNFKVVDISKIPLMFFILDESKIRDEMKKGKTIAGVGYFTEQQPVNNRKR